MNGSINTHTVTRSVAVSVLLLSYCASAPKPTSGSKAELHMHILPEQARLYESGYFLASARALEKTPLVLHTGEHFFEIKASGYFPHDLRLDLKPGKTKASVKLRKIPP